MNTTAATRNRRATYWRYVGNHPSGRNCSRHNKYGYPLPLLEYLAYHRGEAVDVRAFPADQFGQIIQVSAPKDDWEDSWIKCAEEMGRDFATQISEIDDEDGLCWGHIEGKHDLVEFVFRCDETRLEMIQAGHIPVGFHKGKEIWLECKAIAKGSDGRS